MNTSTDAMTRTELLRRVLEAKGADRELDHAIHGLWNDIAARLPFDVAEAAPTWQTPHYTASIDAALALVERVLPGSKWGKDIEEDQPAIEIWYKPKPRQAFREWDSVKGAGATVPLAILAALLSVEAGDE